MREVMAPAKACQQVDGLSGVRYTARDGRYTMSDRDAKALKEAGGFYPNAMGAPVKRSKGFDCGECGFSSFFSTCGRCGAECSRSAGSAAS